MQPMLRFDTESSMSRPKRQTHEGGIERSKSHSPEHESLVNARKFEHKVFLSETV